MINDIPAEDIQKDSRVLFGFWMYLMTDLILFAAFFAVFAVLRGNTFGGPMARELLSAPFALVETLVLLVSSVTCGCAMLAARAGKKPAVLAFLSLTFVLGAVFVSMEVSEFSGLVLAGNGPGRSGFLSSYFTLVGTHGLHVMLGLVWMAALICAIARRGLTRGNLRKLAMLGTFWHFLELIWIWIFAIVYLMGVIL